MTECNASEKLIQDDFFPNLKSRKIEVDFTGGNVSSDGGVLLLRQVDRKIKLLGRASKILDRHDDRQKGKTEHGTYGMLVQRVFGIGCGYEDLNDHNALRHDIVWQTAAGEDGELASAPTLCRFESRATRRMCMELSRLLIDVFMESFEVVGMARNATLEGKVSPLLAEAEKEYEESGARVRKYTSFGYSAESWHGRERKVVAKAEYNEHGRNPRFILTTREGDPGDIYEKEFCPRGDMENRIKEQKLGLFSDRTSAYKWWTNQFRITISCLAYVLFERMRNLALKGTELAEAQVGTIRLKLMKIGTVVRRNTRKIQFSLSSSFPYKSIFWRFAEAFSSS